jgi:hypothetical protein
VSEWCREQEKEHFSQKSWLLEWMDDGLFGGSILDVDEGF